MTYYIYDTNSTAIVENVRYRPYRVTKSYKTMSAAKAALTRMDKAWLVSDAFYAEGIDSANRPLFKYGIAECQHYHDRIDITW